MMIEHQKEWRTFCSAYDLDKSEENYHLIANTPWGQSFSVWLDATREAEKEHAAFFKEREVNRTLRARLAKAIRQKNAYKRLLTGLERNMASIGKAHIERMMEWVHKTQAAKKKLDQAEGLLERANATVTSDKWCDDYAAYLAERSAK